MEATLIYLFKAKECDAVVPYFRFQWEFKICYTLNCNWGHDTTYTEPLELVSHFKGDNDWKLFNPEISDD